MRTLHVSKSETTANKSQSSSKAMHGLFLRAKLSGCQFLLPPSQKKKLLPCAPSFSMSPLSCHVTLYFPVHPPTDVWQSEGVGRGVIDAREACCLALTNELSGQTSSEWE